MGNTIFQNFPLFKCFSYVDNSPVKKINLSSSNLKVTHDEYLVIGKFLSITKILHILLSNIVQSPFLIFFYTCFVLCMSFNNSLCFFTYYSCLFLTRFIYYFVHILNYFSFYL